MNFRKSIWTFAAFFIMLGFSISSCKKPIPEPDPEPDNTIKEDTIKVKPASPYLAENTWIYQQMKEYYLLESSLPSEDKTDKYLKPKDYFRSLINAEKDWFSYFKSDKNDVLGFWWGKPHGFGFRYRPVETVGSHVDLLVTLVSGEAPAGKTDLKRGYVVKKVDGKSILFSDLNTIFDKEKVVLQGIKPDSSTFEIEISKGTYQVDPFKYGQIYEIDQKRIGYFVFSQFLDGIDQPLRDFIGTFKNAGIHDLIIDLRFNPGGFTPNSEVFGSLIVHNLQPGTVMFGGNKNAKQNLPGENRSRTWTNETQNINYLKRVFVITSKSTSSSSELVINSLKPFMEVIIVGDQTYGKNVISTIITDDTGKFNFCIMPAYSTIENALGQSEYGNTKGFIPDYKVEDNLLPLYPLGDLRETLLNKTVSIIIGKPIENLNFMPSIPVIFKDRIHHYDSMQPFVDK